MLDYLKEREQEEMFSTSVRMLAFPDGEARRVEAYRLVWRWFDHTVAYEFAPSADELLTLTLRCAAPRWRSGSWATRSARW